MSANWYFHYQQKGGNDTWHLSLSTEREKVLTDIRPAFSTVLDVSSVPDDNDWSKVRYRGPLYFDFDAENDLPLVCDQFIRFLNKLDTELGFDISQARLFASGGRGFHVEIPQECFIPQVPTTGVPWLPYIYLQIAQALIVDTLDLNVYSGRRGRQWRTTNIERENGNYKVPLSVSEALSMTAEVYAEIVSAPRAVQATVPAHCNSQFAALFERCKDKVVTLMRGKKKRQAKANTFLDPWRKVKKTPPSIERIMDGEGLSQQAGFQSIAMQLGIYATSVEMPVEEYLERCKGLIENHVSNGTRYNSHTKRREELRRMHEYMGENSLYDFDTAPLVRLLAPGSDVSDMGVMATEDAGDVAPATQVQDSDQGDGDEPSVATAPVGVDPHKGVRKGFFMNAQGMFRKTGDNIDSVCRATLRNVESFYDIERQEFKGYEFDVLVGGRKVTRSMLSAEAFTALAPMKKFFVAHQLSFQGSDPDVSALLDVMAEKAGRGGRVYTYPREGFFIVNHPEAETPTPVKVYLTQDTYLCSIAEDDPSYFRLRYRPGQVSSSHMIDIHRAPEMDESMVPSIKDLFAFSRPDVLADLLGWFTACHYRSAYLQLFKQFPLLQIYGEAGAGKTQSVLLMAHLHWYMRERISVNSALSATSYALDAMASTSTSAPMIIDEFKPRELRKREDKYNKLKDVFKASYNGSDIGNRGTVNRNAPESHMSMIKSKACAPIVFMGEAIEMETAIIERSVCLNFNKSYITKSRELAFLRLQSDSTALSALGRVVVEMGFGLNLDAMRKEVNDIQDKLKASMPEYGDENRRRAAPRVVYNRAIVIHGLQTFKRALQRNYGDMFDADVDALLSAKSEPGAEDAKVMAVYGMSEISKVVSRIALLTRDRDMPWEVRLDKDYIVGEGWIEIKLERVYDCYRRYCAPINDIPLFDNLDSFIYALQAYSPCIDSICSGSTLREDGSSERIARLDIKALNREGIQSFKS